MDITHRQTPRSTSTRPTVLRSVTIEVPGAAAETFPGAAFGLDSTVGTRVSPSTASGGPPFVVSLVVGQPSTVDSLVAAAAAAGATVLKLAERSFWGYGGAVRAPGGAVWTIASSSKKETGPATREVDDIVLLLGVADVKASARFYVDRGLAVKRSFGGKYAEFESAPGQVTLALNPRRVLAKVAGVPEDRFGSPRIALGGSAAPFTDPDGFTWAPAEPARA
ncbi:MAG: glyoxalase [Phycicoccus sp.]